MGQRDDLRATAVTAVEGLTGLKMSPNKIKDYEKAITNQWYLDYNESFYGDREYPWLALTFWVDWSFENARRAIKFMDSIDYVPKKIIDLGAGIGLSTAQMALKYPSAEVVYQNIPSLQERVAKRIFDRHGLSNITYSNNFENDADVVLGFEVFEHLHEPVDAARVSLKNTNLYFDSSSFGFPSPGHWPTYLVDGDKEVDGKRMKRFFYKQLRLMGFDYAHDLDLMAKPFWNSRPAVFVRTSWLEYMVFHAL